MPTSGAAQPFRDMGELYPRWTGDGRRPLTIGLACSLNWGAARKLLQQFRAAHPEVDLIIHDVDEPTLTDGLNQGWLDAAIGPRALAQPAWSSLDLCRERLIAVLPERHPLAIGNDVAAGEIRAELILLAGRESGDRVFRWSVIDALGGSPVAFHHYPVQRDTLFDLVALDLGVTICSGAACGAFYPGVCLRPIDGVTGDIAYSLFWTQARETSARTAFISAAVLVGDTFHE